MKLCTIIGARPQFIKAALVSRAIRKRSNFDEILVHTGQHYDPNMSEIFFDELEIPHPDFHLGIGSFDHGKQTGRMLEAIEQVLLDQKPDWVMVYGDTNSTLAGALGAAKLHIPVAHVEAGLRSFNRQMPEEINRVLADHLSTILFTPTNIADSNLRQEGISSDRILNVGDVMLEAANFYGDKAGKDSGILRNLSLDKSEFVLGTIHRAENTDESRRLGAILDAFRRVAKKIPIVLPLHPRTRATIEKLGLQDKIRDLTVIDPVGYLDMVMLTKNAALVATDSGGLQKEAFFHRVPCITLREETEWQELVDLGWNRIAPPDDCDRLADSMLDTIGSAGEEATPYGDGHTVDKILQYFETRMQKPSAR